MKNLLILLALLGIVLFSVSCTEWAITSEKVEEPYLKTMALIARNGIDTSICEGAPGDTMEMHAYFAGVPVTDIKWEVSYNVYKDLYGGDSAIDRSDLSDSLVIIGDDEEFSAATEVKAIKIPIPEDIFYTSSSIDDKFLAELGVNKTQMLSLLESIIEIGPDSAKNDPLLSTFIESVEDNLYQLMQMFTVPVRVYATINGTFKVRADFMIRYNRHFNSFKKVFTNHNPEINYMVIHKFKKDPYPDFSSSKFTNSDTTYILYLRDPADVSHIPAKNIVFNDTILIDSGYTYYVSVDSGFVAGKLQKDSATSMLEDIETGEEGSVSLETFYTHWYYEMDKSETDLVLDYNDHMIINSSGNFMDVLLPPLDTRITNATLWVQVYDFFIGELLRVSGNGIHETKIYFKYTDKYKKEVAKN